MKRSLGFTGVVLAAALFLSSAAFAQNDQTTGSNHDTAKGAAVGAVAGHEVGSGHAVAGAAAGAAIGHHEGKKSQPKGS
jgi:hypothetical protein